MREKEEGSKIENKTCARCVGIQKQRLDRTEKRHLSCMVESKRKGGG